MTKPLINILTLVFVFLGISASASAANTDPRKAEEIKKMMWENGDADFAVTEIPDKWRDKSVVVIAKSSMLSYKKAVFISNLNYNRYTHQRLMLLDKAGIESFSQFTIPENGRYGNYTIEFYAGFKIIKPDGREIEIPMSQAVKEERAVNNSGFNQFKLAIPNLEEGDILDYYIGEERTISIASKYYSFDAVIFQLNDDYPIMKQKITFDVLRRCFINLKSVNGAPDFTLASDDKNDKNTYSLEDSDRESVKDIRWLFPNRQIPSIKFKVTYASAGAATTPTFIGVPGALKSEVSKHEIISFIQYLFGSGSYYGADLIGYMKKNFKKEKDKDKLAREAYYAYRNINRISNVESRQLYNRETNESSNTIREVISLSNYYRRAKIPHNVIIGVPRQISTIDDLILENEIMLMIKVNTSKPFYVGIFTNHSVIGEIDPELQGTKAYEVDGHLYTSQWKLKETNVPAHQADDNITFSTYQIDIADLEEGNIKLIMTKSSKGTNRLYYQNTFMDVYSYKDEEKTRFKMGEDFDGYGRSEQKKLIQKRDDYMANREDKFNEYLKKELADDLGLEIEEAGDLEISQTGRFHDQPEFIFSCSASVKGAIKKVGGNYLISIGKFIDQQVQLTAEEKQERKYDIYNSYARSFNYKIEMVIPEGYKVQGLEKLNNQVENSTGGFVSTAKVEGDKLIIESKKYYSSNFQKKEDWPMMVAFLDAAYNFTQQQILLKKI